MKPWTLICAASLPLLFTVAASAATNRTTRLGQVDSVADSSFIRLLDSAEGVHASRTAEQVANLSMVEGMQLLPYVQQASLTRLTSLPAQYFDKEQLDAGSSGDNFEAYLMLVLAAGLVAVHLRRKQKSLQHRPLAEVMYR